MRDVVHLIGSVFLVLIGLLGCGADIRPDHIAASGSGRFTLVKEIGGEPHALDVEFQTVYVDGEPCVVLNHLLIDGFGSSPQLLGGDPAVCDFLVAPFRPPVYYPLTGGGDVASGDMDSRPQSPREDSSLDRVGESREIQ